MVPEPKGPARATRTPTAFSPRDNFTIVDELALEGAGRVEREPDDGVCAFFGAFGRVLAPHFRAAPARAHGIDHDAGHGCCELLGEHVEGGFADTVSGGKGLGGTIKLAGLAGNVNESRVGGSVKKSRHGQRDSKGADQVGFERLPQGVRGKIQKAAVVVEKDGGIVDEHIQRPPAFFDGPRGGIHAVLVREIQAKAFTAELRSGFFCADRIPAGEDHVSSTIRELFGGGKSNAFGRTGDEDGWGIIFHREFLAQYFKEISPWLVKMPAFGSCAGGRA